MVRVLFAGEQETTFSMDIKGFDYIAAGGYKEESGHFLIRSLERSGHQITWVPVERAGVQLPETLEALSAYDLVILSDIGANTLLFHPEMYFKSVRHPDRLKLLRDYVHGGGALLMIGGWKRPCRCSICTTTIAGSGRAAWSQSSRAGTTRSSVARLRLLLGQPDPVAGGKPAVGDLPPVHPRFTGAGGP
jgi:hypothetical protein